MKNDKKYRAIFFDWDGTAVLSRKAPVEEAVAAMKPLLKQGIKLVIVSGTTMENIAGGEIGRDFTAGGHFIVVYGYDSGGFYINDSNCVARSREKWEFRRLEWQIKHMWVYYPMQERRN